MFCAGLSSFQHENFIDFTTDINIRIKISQKAIWQITELNNILSDSHPTKLQLANSFQKS